MNTDDFNEKQVELNEAYWAAISKKKRKKKRIIKNATRVFKIRLADINGERLVNVKRNV